MKEDNSQSWVRISFGTIRYVNNYVKYNTHNFASSYEEKAEPTSSEVVAARSKAKATTSTEGVHWHNDHHTKWKSMDWHWTIKARSRIVQFAEESDPSSSTQSESTSRARWSSSFFFKIKFHLRDYSLPIQNWSDNRWLACLAAGGGPKRRYQYCSDYLGSIIYLRARSRTFWGQFHWSGDAGSCVNWTWSIFLTFTM